ncbi:hypothetical protein GMLC_40390 [Geomonas limicola]|uniref:Lipoprotein n=1 Tax=Geomonas limicola TaxID=2740186 RepID=A0A6V8NDE4_9BACT|nr:hypothetical protein [Geomonas limicola]GFO70460.1 hypothetical protein GMLC_40390 [Geomonas limicola]
MKTTRSRITLALVLLVALVGCSKKQENAQAPAPAAPQPQAAAGAAPQAAATQADKRDEAEAAPVRDRVLNQVKQGQFAEIYRQASAGFREVGAEERFVDLWKRQVAETGTFQDAKLIEHSVRPQDKFQVFVYAVQYEKKVKQLRLVIGRSKKGTFELTGINQTELKPKG